MKRLDLAILIGLIMTVMLCSTTAFGRTCAGIREDVLRIHVLANSDTNEDQALKLAVRDAVLEQSDILFEQSSSKEQAEQRVMENIPVIASIAKKEIERLGYSYDVSVQLVNMYFETREYPSFTMPAGRYDAVRIVIGSGEGKNWWCVMFPPMCLPAATGDESRAATFSAQEEQLIAAKPRFEPRFAIIELLQKCGGLATELISANLCTM